MVLVLKILIDNTVIFIITNSPHFMEGTDTHQSYYKSIIYLCDCNIFW